MSFSISLIGADLQLNRFSSSVVVGGQVAKANPSSTGLNPAWRKASIHTVFGAGWPEGTSVDGIREMESVIKGSIATLHALAPDSGAYFNEAGPALFTLLIGL